MTVLGALPSLGGGSCPAPAAVIGAIGVGPVCQVAAGVAGLAGSAASQLAGDGANSVLGALGGWVSDGATWLLGEIGKVISTTTSIDLGASWFTAHYQTMAVLAGVVILPLLLLGIMQSIYRQNASMLVRSIVLNVPLAILLTAVAVKLVQLGLAVTDAMSAAVAGGAGLDTGHFLSSVTSGLAATPTAGQPAAPGFIVFLGGLVVVFGALMVWIELLVRSAAVYVAVLFLPLALASLAWPAIAHWCRRLVDTLVALILGKFVIVSVLSLAVGALAGGTGSTPSGSSTGGGGGGFGAVVAGAALLLLAACAPWALFRLLPFLEAGAVGHLEGLSHRARQGASIPAKGLAHVAMGAPVGGGGLAARLGGGAGGGVATGSLAAVGTGRAGAGGDVQTAGPGGDGPPGTRPEPDPSSAESTGVGTMEPPGHDIPAWAVHPKASVTGARLKDIASDGVTDSPAGTGGSATPVRISPRQTGARHASAMARDELGPKLPTCPIPSPPPDPGLSDSRGPDPHHGP
jgi:hypothetical protein